MARRGNGTPWRKGQLTVIVLGLDQAPRGIGWAYGDGSSAPRFGYHECPDYGQDEVALAGHVFDWILTFGKSVGVEVIATEQILINTKRPNTTTLYAQFAVWSAINLACAPRFLNIEHAQVLVSDWRAWFLGSFPRPKHVGTDFLKDLAMRECAARDLYPKTHHEAEAIGIWSYELQQRDPAYRARQKFQTRRAESRRDAERREAM
jgi:hypothetical protein